MTESLLVHRHHGLQFPLEGLVEQGLEEVFGLAFGFALLGAEAFEPQDDFGEFMLERQRGKSHRRFT